MGLWKFGDLEAEVDFTDAVFMEQMENAQMQLEEDSRKVSTQGKQSGMIREQCACFDRFFDNLFGDGACRKMYGDKVSLEQRLQSVDSFFKFGQQENQRIDTIYSKYHVNSPKRRTASVKK